MSDPSSTFRTNLSQFRWASSSQPASTTLPNSSTNPSTASNPNNPFSNLYSSLSEYVPLRSNARSDEEEAYFALSRWERFLGFCACVVGGGVCFLVAFLTLPFLIIKPTKFVMAFTLGSLLFMMGFAVLQGPMNHLKHIFSPERLPFSLTYFGSLALTIYFAVGLKTKIGTLLAAIVQVIALLTYLAAYFPGGLTTLRFGGQMALRGAGTVLPF